MGAIEFEAERGLFVALLIVDSSLNDRRISLDEGELMKMTSKTAAQFKRSARLLPLVASLTALTFVAACARQGKPTNQMSQEQLEHFSLKALARTFPGQNIYAPENMKLSASIESADLTILQEIGKEEGSGHRSIGTKLEVLMKNEAEPLVATGVISAVKSNALENKDQASKIKFDAQCATDDCANVVVQVSLMEEKDVVAVDASAVQTAEQKAETKSTESTAVEDDKSAASTQSADQSAPVAPIEDVKPVEKTQVAVAKAFLYFRVAPAQKDEKKKDLKEKPEAKAARMLHLDFQWASPTEAGKVLSGVKPSLTNALAARKGIAIAPEKSPDKSTVDAKPDSDQSAASNETSTEATQTAKPAVTDAPARTDGETAAADQLGGDTQSIQVGPDLKLAAPDLSQLTAVQLPDVTTGDRAAQARIDAASAAEAKRAADLKAAAAKKAADQKAAAAAKKASDRRAAATAPAKPKK